VGVDKTKFTKYLEPQYLLIPVILLIIQLNFTFAKYDLVSKQVYQLENYQNDSTANTNLQAFNIKYYDSKYTKHFRAQFDFIPVTPGGNLFQTDNEGSGVRLELVQSEIPNKFKLLIQYRAWDGERIIAPNRGFNLNERHSLDLEIDINNRLILQMNSKTIVDQRISKQDIRYKRFVLGAGLSASRIFYGQIFNPKLNLEIFDRSPAIPIEVIILFVLALLIYWSSRGNPNLMSSNILKCLIRDGPGLFIIILSFSFLNFQKPFANFFGDDILNIWPIRSSDVVTIFSESIGPMYRPLTELLFLVRFELHGLNLQAWEIGTKVLAIGFIVYLYIFLRSKLNFDRFLASLVSLAYSTSIQFQASTLWWASNGSQHLLSQILTVYLLTAVIDFFQEENRQKCFNHVVFRSLLLALTSEIFIPVLIGLPVLLYSISRIRIRPINKISNNKKVNGKIRVSSFVTPKVKAWPLALVITFFYLYRTFVVEVSKVVAASSAANYDFQSINILKTVEQFFQYLLVLPGAVTGIYFYDLGAGGGRLKNYSEYTISLKVVVTLFVLVSVIGLCLIVTNSYRLLNLSFTNRLDIILFVIFCITLAVPSMVPDYQQLRWIQFPFLIYLLMISRIHLISNQTEVLKYFPYFFMIGQIVVNLCLLKESFGVILW